MKLDPAFNARAVESPLCRSIIAQSFCSMSAQGLLTKPKPNYGGEAISVVDGIERRFRLRSARKNRFNSLIVTSSSDSVLTPDENRPKLFDDDEVDEIGPSDVFEQWVIAYLLNRGTHTFHEVWIGRVVKALGKKAPYRLVLDDVALLPHDAPLPPDFRPHKDDDLDLGDDDEGEERGEQAG
ncbi:MAG TPA: hypothetical protein VIG64_02230 [Actinomycetota bacterium]|jgi:hypothetical protein